MANARVTNEVMDAEWRNAKRRTANETADAKAPAKCNILQNGRHEDRGTNKQTKHRMPAARQTAIETRRTKCANTAMRN